MLLQTFQEDNNLDFVEKSKAYEIFEEVWGALFFGGLESDCWQM